MILLRRYSLPLILLLALALRLINLTGRSLWYDEAFAVLFADKGLSAMLYGTLTPVAGGAADIHPLLYYVTLDGWMALFGSSPFAVRFWSVLLGVATVGMVYLLGRDLFSRQTGYAAALVAAVAPFHVQYSQETRMYALLGLLLMAATWCFVRGSRPPAPMLLPSVWRRWLARWGWWAAFGVLAALAMYTQQLAAFYLAALGVVPLFTRNRRQMRGVALGAGIALVLYLPWLAQLPAQLAKVGSYYWIPVPHPARLALTLRTFLSAGIDLPGMLAVYTLAGAMFILVFLALQAARALRRPRRTDRASLLFALWLFAAPVLLMWAVSQVRPVYLDRALLPSALMLYVALGWMFTRGGLPRPIAAVIAVVGIALSVASLQAHYTWRSFPNSPFDQAAQTIQAQFQAGDIVVHQSKLSALPMLYYAPDVPQTFIADAPGSPEDTLALPTREVLNVAAYDCVAGAGQGAARVWFVYFPDVIRQAEAAGRDDVTAAFSWLETHYTQVEQQQFNDLDVVLYANPDEGARSTDCPPREEAA